MTWRTQQESSGLWSAYENAGLRHGDFRDEAQALTWINRQRQEDHLAYRYREGVYAMRVAPTKGEIVWAPDVLRTGAEGLYRFLATATYTDARDNEKIAKAVHDAVADLLFPAPVIPDTPEVADAVRRYFENASFGTPYQDPVRLPEGS